jgi:prophage regulatory protein
MSSKQRPQVELALKAARLKAKQSHPSPTRQQVDDENLKRRVVADAFIEDQESVPKLLTKRQVLARICLTYPTIWKWMQEGRFPRAREVGGKSCWVESEINHWIETLPIRRLKSDKEADHDPPASIADLREAGKRRGS